jgi:hypothetical protein
VTEAEKDRYFELLTKLEVQQHAAEELELKRHGLPPSLFRFRKLDLFAISELRESYVWLADPETFNDPFDSALSVSSSKWLQRHPERLLSSPFGAMLTEEEKRIIFRANDPPFAAAKIAEEKSKSEGFKSSDGLLEKFVIHLTEQVSTAFSKKLSEDIRGSLRICCFCENRDSIVMWSHYAASHSGICIEYATQDLCENDFFFFHLHPVAYKEELIDVSPFLGLPNMPGSHPWMSTIAACHKSPEWDYEGEWRFVAPFGLLNEHPRFCLSRPPKSITLGANVLSPGRELVCAIAGDLGVPVFQARLVSNRFKLEFDPIK